MSRRRLSSVLALAALLLALAAALPVAARQAPVTLRATLDRERATVGDRITVTVQLSLPVDAQADLKQLEQQFGELELLLVGLAEDKPAGGQREVRQDFEVAAFRTGAALLPALSLVVRLASGESVTATTEPRGIAIESVIPAGEQPADVRDLKPQITLAETSALNRRALLLSVAALALALAGGLLLVRRLRRPRAVIVPLPRAAPSAEAVARAELDRIAGLGLLERGDLKQYHALLAVCIRRYLTARYEFHAFAMTTTELRRLMEAFGVERWQARLVSGLLTESDAVVYAQYTPARPRCEANLEMAYRVVDAGEPVPVEPPPPATAAPARAG